MNHKKRLKATLVLLLAITQGLHLMASPYDVDLSMKNRPASEVFSTIMTQTGLTFTYSASVGKVILPEVNFVAKGVSAEDILQKVFYGSPLEYKINGNIIAVTLKEQSLSVQDPQPTDRLIVKGRVFDVITGESVPGAGIIIKGTTRGVTSDIDGNYTIELDPGDVIVCRTIGYGMAEIDPAGRTVVDFGLHEESEMLDEVVMVGYGVQKKVNLSGAVATVKMDDVLGDRPQPNVAAVLQGAIPGLTVTSSSNTPGQTGKSLQIRGTSSFSGSTSSISSIAPLILIDNVPGDIDALNPSDIESVSVLKDASASAIYGARAAAGVVLISTKRPEKAAKSSVNYSGSIGLVNAISTPAQVGFEDYFRVYTEALSPAGIYTAAQSQDFTSWLEYVRMYNDNPSELSSLGTLYDGGIFISNADGLRYYLSNEDIYGRMMETGVSQNHKITMRGASDKVRYRMSANLYDEDGPLFGEKDCYTRKVVSAYVSSDITSWLTQELDVYYTVQNKNMIVDEHGGLYAKNCLQFQPDTIDPDGFLVRTPKNILLTANTATTDIIQPKIFSKTTIKPVKGLNLIFEYNHQRKDLNYRYDSGTYSYVTIQLNHLIGPDHDYSIARNSIETRNSVNAYATYNFKLDSAHDFIFTGGFNQESWGYEYYNTRAEDQAVIDIPSMSNAHGIITTSDKYQDYALRSLFARFNYNYGEKYIFEASCRYDGSSKFSSATRWGFFPSFSAAWNIMKEPFMSGVKKYVSQLKPRFSYGAIGNQTSVGYYDYISSMGLSTTSNVWFSGNDEYYVTQISSPAIISDQFTWETITTANAGLDFAMFGNRLSGSIEAYRRKVTDILSESVQLPAALGDDAPLQNVGSMHTDGWELQLNWKDKLGKDIHYNIGVNLWDYQSFIDKINFNEANSLSSLYTGKRTGDIWGYVWDGFYSVNDFSDTQLWILKDDVVQIDGVSPRPGDFKYKNLRNGDNSNTDINSINEGKNTLDNPGDQVVIGNATPRFQFGVNLGVNYKGIGVSVMLQGVGKRQNWLDNCYIFTRMSTDMWTPVYEGTLDYWSPISMDIDDPDYMLPVNPKARLPRVYDQVGNNNSNHLCNDHMLSNTAYLRLKNLTVSYDFPAKMLRKIHVDKLHVYASAENLFTISPLPKGIDPETLSWSYPLYKTVSFGLNFTF